MTLFNTRKGTIAMVVAISVIASALVTFALPGLRSADGLQGAGDAIIYTRDVAVNPSDGLATVTLTIKEGNAVPAAVRTILVHEPGLELVSCTPLVTWIACTDYLDTVRIESVTDQAWPGTTDLAELIFDGAALAEPVTVDPVVERVLSASLVDLNATTSSSIVAPFEMGDVDCNTDLNILDALLIAQASINAIGTGDDCNSYVSSSTVFEAGGDINNDGETDIMDALIVARCAAGIAGPLCW